MVVIRHSITLAYIWLWNTMQSSLEQVSLLKMLRLRQSAIDTCVPWIWTWSGLNLGFLVSITAAMLFIVFRILQQKVGRMKWQKTQQGAQWDAQCELDVFISIFYSADKSRRKPVWPLSTSRGQSTNEYDFLFQFWLGKVQCHLNATLKCYLVIF